MKGSAIRILAVIAVVLALAAAYWLLHETGTLATILDGPALRQRIVALGAAGPFVVRRRVFFSPTSAARWRPANLTG